MLEDLSCSKQLKQAASSHIHHLHAKPGSLLILLPCAYHQIR